MVLGARCSRSATSARLGGDPSLEGNECLKQLTLARSCLRQEFQPLLPDLPSMLIGKYLVERVRLLGREADEKIGNSPRSGVKSGKPSTVCSSAAQLVALVDIPGDGRLRGLSNFVREPGPKERQRQAIGTEG